MTVSCDIITDVAKIIIFKKGEANMKKQILKTLFCLSLTAAITLGETGAAFAETVEVSTEAEQEDVLETMTAEETTEQVSTEETEEMKTEDTETEIPLADTEKELEAETVEEPSEEDVDSLGAKIVASNTLAGSAVTGLSFDSVTRVLSWNKVKNASTYKVEVYGTSGKVISSSWCSDLYCYISRFSWDYNSDTAIAVGSVGTVRVTAYNRDELYLVASNLTYEAAQKYWSDSDTYRVVSKTVGTTTSYTVYAYPATAASAGAAIQLNPADTTTARVSSLAGLVFKEVTESNVVFSVSPSTIQRYEEVEYQYANNASYLSDGVEKINGSGSVSTNSYGTISDDIEIPLSVFTPGDTLYVRARVYNDDYEGAGSSYSAYVTATYQIPAAEMRTLNTVVTSSSIRLEPSVEGKVTGFCYQKKNGKKWIDLGSQPDAYTDKGLLADKKYTYRVRGYIYNPTTKKTSYTDWKMASAYTWGSALNLKGNAKNATAVSLSWNKVAKAEGYEIYRVESDSYYYNINKGEGVESFDNAVLVKTIKKAKTTKFTDKKLTKGADYHYYVRAYRTVNKNKYYIEDSVSVSLAANGAWEPQTSYYLAGGEYMVTWKKMAGISGYKVEKRDAKTGKYMAYKTLGKSATSVKLPKVSIGASSESYRIRVYKGKKVYNNDYSFTVSPMLSAVKNVKAVQTAEGVRVTWSPVSGADYYCVYRAKQDSFTYNKTTKTYTLGSGAEMVYEANYKDTSAGVSLLPSSGSAATGYVYGGNAGAASAALYDAAYKGAFYEDISAYKTTEIKGTSVVDKTITVKGLVHKSDLDPNYNSDKDTDKTGYPFKQYAKEANGALKTKTTIMVQGPQEGTQYYYFVQAVAKTANGANQNETETYSIGYTKAASVVYTKVTAAKAAGLKSAKSSKKASVTLKIKKAAGAKGYAIYRSTKKGKGYVQVGTSTKLTYTDNDVTAGKTYYYKVAAYKLSENGTFIYYKQSAAKKVKVKK